MNTIASREILIEKYRHINVDSYQHWDEDVISDFVSRMQAIGIRVSENQVRWSGFCSQGDGAAFDGYVQSWGLFMDAVFKPESIEYKYMQWLCDFSDPFVSWYSRGRYAHEQSLQFNFEGIDYFENLDIDVDRETDEFVFERSIGQALSSLFSLRRFDATVEDAIRGFCCDLYRELEDLYEYLTSDDAVWETVLEMRLDEEERTS